VARRDGVQELLDLAFSAVELKAGGFTAKELKEFETQAMVGTGYQLTLRWGSFKPKSDRVSVIARHPIGEGRYLYSTPGVIACAP
jgi:hypothetical protein